MDFTEAELRSLSQGLREPEWLLQERLQAFSVLQKILNDPHLKQRPSLPKSLAAPQIKVKKQKGVRMAKLHELLKGREANRVKTIFLDRRAKDERSWQMNFLNAFFTECNVLIAEDPGSALELESQGGPAMQFIVLEKGVTLEYTHTVKREGFQSYEVWADEDAAVSRLLVHPGGEAGFLSSSFLVGKQARMEHLALLRGGGNVEVKILLNGAHAEAHDIAIFSERDAKLLTITSLLHQIAPETKGDILVKGIARETAQAKLEGMIRIDKDARNSDSFLDQHVLLLNAGARADANPQLEIENNDVRSSHSASVGQISAEKLFYLMSRGISAAGARGLLVEGFLGSAISRIRTPGYKERAREMFLGDDRSAKGSK